MFGGCLNKKTRRFLYLGVLLPKDFGARGGAGARFWFWSNTRPLRREHWEMEKRQVKLGDRHSMYRDVGLLRQ